jgi:4-amino-4-deoxy-L-arabinose transferase-like glycosyltransferase
MIASSLRRSFRLAVLVAAILFAAKAVFLALAPIRGLGLTTWIIDDTFIIARVARNIALGYGFSYDFTHATTGAPPLWTYLTAVNHVVFPSLEWAMKATFIETTLLGSLATLVVFLLARKVTKSEEVAWIAFILSSFTANAFFQAMNGMDTSLFTLSAVLAFAMYMGVFRPSRCSDACWAAATGAVIGFTCLVRGDGIFVLAAIGLMELIGLIREPRSWRRQRFVNLVILSAVAAGFIGLLIGWQMVRTGTPFLGNQVGRRELAMSLHGFDFGQFVFSTYIKIVGWNVFQLENLVNLASGSTVFALFALGLGWLQAPTRRLATVTAVYMAIFFGLLVSYQWYFPDLHGLRYVNPAVHVLFVFMGLTIALLPLVRYRTTVQWLLVIAMIVLSHYRFYHDTTHLKWAYGMSYVAHPSKADEEAGWATIDWVRANLPEGTVIGVRDHGRFALFSDRPTQDIAGNIDPTVPLLARTSGLKDYLKNQNVSYLLIPTLEQRQDLIYRVLHGQLKLQRVQTAPEFRGSFLYRIVW